MIGEILAQYGWWILGFALLGLELAIPGVYLIFFGIAALVVGTNAFLLGDGWFSLPQQLIAFVVVSAVAIFLGQRWYGRARHDPAEDEDNPLTRLIGREAQVSEAIVSGRGRIALGDGWWTVEGPDLPKGARVRIVKASANVLTVVPLAPNALEVPVRSAEKDEIL